MIRVAWESLVGPATNAGSRPPSVQIRPPASNIGATTIISFSLIMMNGEHWWMRERGERASKCGAQSS